MAERRLDRVKPAGQVAPARVIPFLAAADVLVLPNSGTDIRATHYASPMKLFEFVAARRPTVASRLPASQDLLRNGENAPVVKPNDPKSLARGIMRLPGDDEVVRRLAEIAWREVQRRSCGTRARSIQEIVGAEAPLVGARAQGPDNGILLEDVDDDINPHCKDAEP